MIAELITQHRGEYVLRVGEQPPRAQLFTGELSDDTDGWSGIPRTVQELDLLKDGIIRTVEEVGGKVGDAHISTQKIANTMGSSDLSSVRITDGASTDISIAEVTSFKCLFDP